jgi:hypothetical protein
MTTTTRRATVVERRARALDRLRDLTVLWVPSTPAALVAHRDQLLAAIAEVETLADPVSQGDSRHNTW